ncbi:phosphoenolpyruvate carboxykinase (ATP) [Synergistaceae bacterium OttesenSCG-928-D05]|nr:phosphoenolpyruvate carboxykinase (ATP) [Synergistaceae bacterium OttesenSCG-928-D05]
MATQDFFSDLARFKKLNAIPVRTTIETAFYGNNVVRVNDLHHAYELAKNSPGTIELTGMPVHRPKELGLPEDSNVLLFNDGAIFGRCAAARRIVGYPDVPVANLCTVVREAVYGARYKKFYHAQAVIGLDEDFMVKANIMLPEGFENSLYSWMLNFQYMNDEYRARYAESRPLENDGELFVFADPDWRHPDYPLGLAFFSPEQNCAAILGMRYFGEFKKGTLTLAWGAAARNGYASCHGGLKRYALKDGSDDKYVLAVFGLSGSGKSTITHAKHKNKYDVTVLHDDAVIINVKEKYAIALEPAYFDKMQDYPMGCEDNKFLLTLQNCGVVENAEGKRIVVSEDIRNGNGRAVKSRFWSPNRIDRIDEPLNAICWLMKDPTLPPVLKVDGPALASVMGATLATRRTTAEHLAPGVDPDALVIESYANPFRTYPLAMDYIRFRALFEDGVECFILNTGFFMDKKVEAKHTLGVLESIVERRAKFVPFGGIPGLQTMEISGFSIDFTNWTYKQQVLNRMNDRLEFVKSREKEKGGMDALPPDALESLQKVTAFLKK